MSARGVARPRATAAAQDDEGHGTHVAGIIAADTFNGKGVAGVAPGADLVVAKALDASGSGALADVERRHPSGSSTTAPRSSTSAWKPTAPRSTCAPGQSLADGVEYAWRHGAIPVVAAGNATPSLFGPAGYAGVDAVIVGATGPQRRAGVVLEPVDRGQVGGRGPRR